MTEEKYEKQYRLFDGRQAENPPIYLANRTKILIFDVISR